MTESAADNDREVRDDVDLDFVPASKLFDRVMTDGGTRPLELQEMYDLLADPRRRRVVEYIARNGPADISELTDHIAGLEIGDEASGQPRKRVYIGIYQNHLPALVEADVLTRFDREYRPGPNFEQVQDAINQVEGVYDAYSPPDVEADEDDVDDDCDESRADGGTSRPIPPDEPLDELETDGGEENADR